MQKVIGCFFLSVLLMLLLSLSLFFFLFLSLSLDCIQCKSWNVFSLLLDDVAVAFHTIYSRTQVVLKCFALLLVQNFYLARWFNSNFLCTHIEWYANAGRTLAFSPPFKMLNCWKLLTLTQLILYTKLSARAVEYSWARRALVISLQNGSLLFYGFRYV